MLMMLFARLYKTGSRVTLQNKQAQSAEEEQKMANRYCE